MKQAFILGIISGTFFNTIWLSYQLGKLQRRVEKLATPEEGKDNG